MIIGQQPSSATFRPAVGQCQCGNINNCICGGAMGMPPHAELPNQCIPYNPSMPIPADVSQPHLYDPMPTTSQYNMPPCPTQQVPPQPQQAPQQQQYPQQPPNSCSNGYARPPSRVQANSHTMQWMNNHYMNNGYSPAPSVTPSVMSMSHMSIPDDHLSQMSIHCPSEMRTPIDTPQFTELRPCSQISTASCVENIDPRMPRQPSNSMSYQQLIDWYHNENLRSEVVNETFKIARGLTKGIGPAPDFQLLVKITEVFKYWNLPPQEECAKKLASAMFYLCKYLPSTEVKKALSATSGDMIHILVGLGQYNNGALLALIHMIEWRNREGVELRAFCRNPKVFDLFMQKLIMVDQKNLGCYQYVLEGLRLLCHNNKEAKDYLIAWGQNNQQYNGPKGIVPIIFLIFFRFLDQMCHAVEPKYKEFICTSYTKALALLHSIIMKVEPKQVDRVNVAVAQQIFQCNGPQIISHYVCVGSAMAMKYAMELLASLTNSEFASAIDHLPPEAVQAIIRNVLQGLQMLINDSRFSNDPSLWEKAFAFIANFIANRTQNKLMLIDLNGFEAIVYGIMRFSNFKERKDMTAQQYITLNELADNADLCLSALMSVKTLNINQVKLRDTAVNNNALQGILNQLCQADIYVQKRVLRLLYQLVDAMPIFRSDGYLQQVFDDFRKENLIGCLYRIIASAPEQLTILDNKQNATNKDVERRRLVPDVLCRTFNLLCLVLKYCNLGPREDILLLVKNNPMPVMELLKYFYQEVELCSSILRFCYEVGQDEIIASRWLTDRQFLESLVNSCDPKIAVPSQHLMTRLCTAGDFEPLAGMFTGMNGSYLE